MTSRTALYRRLAASLLLASVMQFPATAAPSTPSPAAASVARQLQTVEPAAPAAIDDAMRLSVMVRNQIARRHEGLRRDVFATVDGMALHLPGREVVVLGYHEARAEHLTLAPASDHVVMPSRGREGTPTSAVDVVMPAGEDVLAPVSGRVVKVADYLLYDEYADVMVEIVPDDRPDLVVTLFHVSGVKVREGQHVAAGESVIADSARVFDFVAQVEQWGRGPHVDIRVRGD